MRRVLADDTIIFKSVGTIKRQQKIISRIDAFTLRLIWCDREHASKVRARLITKAGDDHRDK